MSGQQQLALRTFEPLELPSSARDQNAYWVYLGSLGRGSRPTMRSSLQATAQLLGEQRAPDFPWHALRYPHVAMLRSWLAERHAPANCNRWLCAVRGVLKAAWKLGHIEGELYRRAISVEPVRGKRLPPGRSLSSVEICSVFQSCDRSPVSYRDGAIMSLLYGAGLRRAEVCALDVEDFDSSSGTLRVMGKGNAERVGFLGTGAPELLKRWLHVRAAGCDAVEADSGPLLLPLTRRRGRFVARRIVVETVRGAVARACRRAGVEHFTAHDLRRTYVSDLLHNGADLATVQKLVGHSSPTTTASYDRRGDEERAKAARRLVVPLPFERDA